MTDPDAVAKAIPGVQSLTPIPGEPLAWSARISLAFIAINAEFGGEVRMGELSAPSQYRLTVSGGGDESRITGSALITLQPDPENPDFTDLAYAGTASMTGKFEAAPPAIVKSVVMMIARQFFGALARQLRASGENDHA